MQVGYSAIVFYGYVGVIGLALWAMLKWWFKSEVGLAQVWCIYGEPHAWHLSDPRAAASNFMHQRAVLPRLHGMQHVLKLMQCSLAPDLCVALDGAVFADKTLVPSSMQALQRQACACKQQQCRADRESGLRVTQAMR